MQADNEMDETDEMDEEQFLVDAERDAEMTEAAEMTAGVEAARLGVDSIRSDTEEARGDQGPDQGARDQGSAPAAEADDPQDKEAEEVASGPTIQSIETACALELYTVLLCKLNGNAPYVG